MFTRKTSYFAAACGNLHEYTIIRYTYSSERDKHWVKTSMTLRYLSYAVGTIRTIQPDESPVKIVADIKQIWVICKKHVNLYIGYECDIEKRKEKKKTTLQIALDKILKVFNQMNLFSSIWSAAFEQPIRLMSASRIRWMMWKVEFSSFNIRANIWCCQIVKKTSIQHNYLTSEYGGCFYKFLHKANVACVAMALHVTPSQVKSFNHWLSRFEIQVY